jgi:predicted ATPase
VLILISGLCPNNLPAQAIPFIGRGVQLAAVRKELIRPEVRLLTLTGPGGTGKTRLGLRVAADLLDHFQDGVFFVGLASVSDPTLVMPTIAQTLGVREAESGPFGPALRSTPVGQDGPLLKALRRYLRDKHILLVLDNFEQVTPASPVVGDLLATAPRLKVLVTSRASLRVYGEHEYPVPPLVTPDLKELPHLERLAQVEAVQLFVERAQAVKPDFAITNENGPAVAEICQHLDGLPLAIELAAARVRLLPPHRMLAQLGTASGCSQVGPETCRPGTRPCAVRLIGATSCWMKGSGSYSGGWPCFAALAHWRRWRRCATPQAMWTC